MLFNIFSFKKARTSTCRVNRAKKKRVLLLEQLEAKTPLAWDLVGTFGLSDGLPRSIGGLTEGQKIQINAVFIDDQPATFQEARVSFSGGSFFLDSIRNQKTLIVYSPGSNFSIIGAFGSAGGLSGGDTLTVTIEKEHLSNLVATTPVQISDGAIEYGYYVEGDSYAPISYRDWVFVELYYAKGPNPQDILNAGNPIAKSTLLPLPAPRSQFQIPKVTASQLKNYGVPEGATHLVTIIDRLNQAAESNESVPDNFKALPLPNLKVAAPTYKSEEMFGASYSVTGSLPFVRNAQTDFRAELYYARGESLSDIIGAPIAFSQIRQIGDTILATPDNPPVGTTHILFVVDRLNRVAESNENDNVKATRLPDFSVLSIEWDGSGGVRVRVNAVSSASLPFGSNPGIALHWATSSLPESTDLLTRLTLPRAALRKEDGIVEVHFRGPIPTVNQSIREVLPSEFPPVSHLFAQVTFGRTVFESSKSNNYKAVELGQVSDELSDSYPASTAAERVRMWIRKYQGVIRLQAEKHNIDPRAIAGAIAWEAIVNTNNTYPTPYGPGKVHYTGVAIEVESLNLTSQSFLNPASRVLYLRTPKGAIEYVAAILKAYSDVLAKHGLPPKWDRNGNAILATLYNGAGDGRKSIAEYDAWLTENPGYTPRPSDALMGGWFVNNIGSPARPRYIDSLLTYTYSPKIRGKPLPIPRPVTVTTERATSIVVSPLIGLSDPNIQISGVTQPVFGSIQVVGKNLVYTPNADFAGEDRVYFSIRDSDGSAAGAVIKFNVNDLGPTNLTHDSVGENSLRLNWVDRTFTEVGFEVQVRSESNPIWTSVSTLSPNSTSVEVSGLARDTSYQFRIRAILTNGSSVVSNEIRVRTLGIAPSVPGNLRSENVWARMADIGWDQSTGPVNFYAVSHSIDQVNWSPEVRIEPSRTSYRLEFLQPNTVYYVRIRASGSGANSDYSPFISFSTKFEAPSTPANLRAANVWARTADIRWDASVGITTSYALSFRKSNSSWGEEIQVAESRTSYRLEGLDSHSTYFARIRSSGPGGFSEFSDPIEFLTDFDTPSVPGNLRSENIWARMADIGWDQSTGPVDFYAVSHSNDQVNWSPEIRIEPSRTSYRMEFLQPNTEYYVRIRASGPAAYSEYSSPMSFSTKFEAPSTPVNLRAANVWARTADVRWDASIGSVSKYLVSISADGQNWGIETEVDSGKTSLRFDGISPNSRYFVRVRADGPGGRSLYSDLLEFRTDHETPTAPTSLRTTSIWARAVDVSWLASFGDLSEYRIAISTDGSNWSNSGIVSGDRLSFRIEGLTPGKRYWVKVRANGLGGFSDYSNTIEFSTKNL